MVLIFAPVITDVINIKAIGKIFINNKNKNFLSFKLILNLIFFNNKYIKKKNGISIPICLSKKINGNFIWSRKIVLSKPVLFKPYKIVIKSLS